MKRKGRIALIAFAFGIACSSIIHAGTLETVSVADFLKLPDDLQAIYVAGILDGMSYVIFNYQLSEPDKWAECVRLRTLDETLNEVLAYLKNNPSEASYPLPWAVARTIGQRSCLHQ
jgi:hypothetical protein